MNNLAIVIPDPWFHHGNGNGHLYGRYKHSDIGQLFGLTWAEGT